jgi:transcriptional regulator with XRE-family HTH domain
MNGNLMFPLVRTSEQLKEARQKLGLSAENLARVLRVEDGRTVRRWEAGERAIPGPVTVVMETIMGNLAQQEMITRQLEMLRSGMFKIGSQTTADRFDESPEEVTRLEMQRAELKGALTLLLRQPETNAGASDQVHWYQLSRRTPKHQPPESDDWSLPGELSPEAALFYFSKHERVAPALELCSDDEPSEFALYQRELHRIAHGVSVRLSPGKTIRSFSVRRVVLPGLR